MIRRPPRSTRTDTLFPYTTLFRSVAEIPQYIVNLAFGRTFTLACRHRHALPEAAVVCRKLRKNLLLARDRQVEHVRGSAIRSRLRQSSASAREPRLPAFSNQALNMRSEEHTSELQSLMRISYAVFCLKNKNTQNSQN